MKKQDQKHIETIQAKMEKEKTRKTNLYIYFLKRGEKKGEAMRRKIWFGSLGHRFVFRGEATSERESRKSNATN